MSVASVLGPWGSIARQWPEFESQPEQLEMASAVARAINERRHLMVEAGTDLKRLTRFGGNGLTPAAEKGHLEIVRYLLENTTINVNLTNTLGWTALIETIILGDGGPVRQQTAELLLQHGAKPGMTDEWGVAPLDLARKRGFDDLAAVIERYL